MLVVAGDNSDVIVRSSLASRHADNLIRKIDLTFRMAQHIFQKGCLRFYPEFDLLSLFCYNNN